MEYALQLNDFAQRRRGAELLNCNESIENRNLTERLFSNSWFSHKFFTSLSLRLCASAGKIFLMGHLR